MQPRTNKHAERERPPRNVRGLSRDYEVAEESGTSVVRLRANGKGVRRLLKDYELSDETGIPVDTLRQDRIHARRIPFIKLGRSVWYDLDAVLAALQQFRLGGAARKRAR